MLLSEEGDKIPILKFNWSKHVTENKNIRRKCVAQTV